jgi:hypothetical protein
LDVDQGINSLDTSFRIQHKPNDEIIIEIARNYRKEKQHKHINRDYMRECTERVLCRDLHQSSVIGWMGSDGNPYVIQKNQYNIDLWKPMIREIFPVLTDGLNDRCVNDYMIEAYLPNNYDFGSYLGLVEVGNDIDGNSLENCIHIK